MAALLGRSLQTANRCLFSRTLTRPLTCSTVLRGGEIKDTSLQPFQSQTIEVSQQEDVSIASAIPEEHIVTRHVRIFKPAKNAMQSGTHGARLWRMEFDSRERWENPLMGWSSSGDPLSTMNVDFNSKEDAMHFCEKMGWDYHVEEKEVKPRLRPKNYGSNFSWNKKTRVSTK